MGDRFYLADNKILCEFDYEERMMFANLNSGATHPATNIPNGLSNGIPPASVGGGGGGGGGGAAIMGNGITSGGGMSGLNGGNLTSMAGGGGLNPYGYGSGYNALTQIKKQTQSLSDDVSSGYGSPSPTSL